MFYRGDAIEQVSKLTADKYYAVITSPPYFNRVDYGHPDQTGYGQSFPEYIFYQLSLFKELYRVTVPGGAMFINLGNIWNNYGTVKRLGDKQKPGTYDPDRDRTPIEKLLKEKELIDLDNFFIEAGRKAGWLLRDRYIWVKPAGNASGSDRSGNAYETILYFRKPDKPGRYRSAYWDGTYLPRNVLEYSPSADKRHPCVFPESLVRVLMLATVPVGGSVLDPYCGSGTVMKVAEANDRKGDGIDLNNWRG